MFAASTKLKNAEKVKRYLLEKKLLNTNYLPVKELGFIFFPMNKRAKIPKAEVVEPAFEFPEKEKPITVEEILKKKLTSHQLALLPKSQEIVGTILILEIPKKIEKKETLIAEAYLKATHHITTVVKKTEIHHGEFRLRGVKILAGKRTKETIHQESGVQLQLHLEKTYFSARSANERLRIAKQVKEGETVLVMFAGCGPFPLVIAKNSMAHKIDGIELNPFAHQYAVKNIKRNNFLDKVRMFNGDVREILPKWRRQYDRIVMPLPKTGEEFLPLALRRCKKNGTVHLYAFLNEDLINKEAQRLKKTYPVNILRKVKCGQFSPGTYRVCFDLQKK